MRLFVAFSLPGEVRRRIHEAVRPLRERDLPVRWVDPGQYHVTMKFLGEVAEGRLPEIEERLTGVTTGSGSTALELGGVGAFPTIRRPRVLWLGVEATPALRCLKQDLEWAFAESGFERDTRAFHPHVTLGRARDGGGAGAFRGLDEVCAEIDFGVEVPVDALDLVRSRLSRDGPRHSVVSSNPLGGRA